MHKVRYLSITFENELRFSEIKAFRGAVIEFTRRTSSLFHNHQGEEGYLYRYPLIQYKPVHKKAAIICLNEGADDIHFLLREKEITLDIYSDKRLFTIADIHQHYAPFQTWDRSFSYYLNRWLPLNQHNYPNYKSMDNPLEQMQFLERILRNNFISLAKGIGWQVEREIFIRIDEVISQQWLPYKDKQKLLAFNLRFQSNVSLPDFIGIGKGSSIGFGVVRRVTRSAS